MKIFISLAVCVLVITAVFAGCGCAADVKTNDTNSQSGVSANDTDETLKLIETTPDGGTVEQDSDGNTIKKDKNGDIVSVEDKNGSSVNADEYVRSHPYATKNTVTNSSSDSAKSSVTGKKSGKTSSASSGGSGSTASVNKSGGSGSDSAGKSDKNGSAANDNSNSKSSLNSNSSKSGEVVEEEIPTVIAVVPDEDEQETIDFE